MVKNLSGGGKSKQQGRKFTSNNASRSALRLSTNELEVYGIVIKVFGGGRVSVQTVNESLGELQMIIRHKFKKRNSNVIVGSIILCGLREWEGPDHFKTCDILELYDQDEHNLLKSIPTTHIHTLDKFTHNIHTTHTTHTHNLLEFAFELRDHELNYHDTQDNHSNDSNHDIHIHDI
jgi:translation initiation factor IF-1